VSSNNHTTIDLSRFQNRWKENVMVRGESEKEGKGFSIKIERD
jgi:hypothetical protein